MLEKIPDLEKILQFGQNIFEILKKLETIYKDLCEIEANDIKVLKIYTNFLRHISNNDLLADPLIEK